MRPPRLRCTLFPLIYPPHLLVLPATLGLHLFWQTYPYFRALYVISVRRTKSLLTASFRFHLTMDTLAVLLYTSSLPRRVRDFHPLERAHGAQTKKGRCSFVIFLLHLLLILFFFLFSLFPGHLQLSFLRNTIRKIQIYQRLIWNPGTLRLRFKIIDHIPIKIYCYLFFNPL